jgi:isocitrate/isopropylmalate dehydrogenase
VSMRVPGNFQAALRISKANAFNTSVLLFTNSVGAVVIGCGFGRSNIRGVHSYCDALTKPLSKKPQMPDVILYLRFV